MTSLPLLLLFACLARAQESISPSQFPETESSEPEQGGFDLKARDTLVLGNHRYRSNDAAVVVALPRGVELAFGHSLFESEISSFTQSASFGADKSWDFASVGATYSWFPLQNDSKIDSADVRASVQTRSRHFQTSLGVDLSAMEQVQYVRSLAETDRMEVTQRGGTVSLKQALFDTLATADLTKFQYNRDITAYSQQLARAEEKALRSHPGATPLAEPTGAVVWPNSRLAGYPDWSAKLGLYQTLGRLTVWGTAQRIAFVPAYLYTSSTLLSGWVADIVSFGMDVELGDHFAAGLQYSQSRQTDQPFFKLYGVSLTAKL